MPPMRFLGRATLTPSLVVVLSALLAAVPALAVPLVASEPPAESLEGLGQAFRAGIAALAAGKLGEAQAAFDEAVKVDRRSPAPLLGLAEVAFQRKKRHDALARIKEAIEVTPNYSSAHAAMGRYLQITGKPKDAEVSLRKAIQLD